MSARSAAYRVFWLSRRQRGILSESLALAVANGADENHCRAISRELGAAQRLDTFANRMVRTLTEGLHLPAGSAPVLLCDDDIEVFASYHPDQTLFSFLSPVLAPTDAAWEWKIREACDGEPGTR